MERWKQRERLLNLRAGLAPAAILNLFLPKRHRVGPLDFFEGKKKTARQSPAEMLNMIAAFNAAVGGRDLRKKKDDSC
jgi:hypothetical protein